MYILSTPVDSGWPLPDGQLVRVSGDFSFIVRGGLVLIGGVFIEGIVRRKLIQTNQHKKR